MSNLKFKNNPCAEHLDVETADDWCPVCLHEENASLKAEVERLKMCQSDKATKSILYTDTIGGEQVCRDDMWAISTTTLNALTASEQRVKDLENDLRTARDAIAQAPEDAFGHVDETSVDEGWWIRDELVANFSQTLDGAEHDDAALSDTERGKTDE